jgi:agmatinase
MAGIERDVWKQEVDVAVVGAPLDMLVGQRGTAYGPRALRTADRYLPGGPLAPAILTHIHVMVEPFDALKCVDDGDSNADRHHRGRGQAAQIE